MARYPIISSHPLPTLLEPEWLFLKNSLRMLCEVRQSVDDGLSAFKLHHFSKLWSSQLRAELRGHDRANLDAVIVRVWRYTWRLPSSECGVAVGGHDHLNLEAVIARIWRYALGGHECAILEAVIERVWRCTWRPRSSEFAYMHFEAMGVRTWKLWSCECGDTFGGHDPARWEIH